MEPCYGSLQVCYLRGALLGADGLPLVGAENAIVRDDLITMDVKFVLEPGDDLSKKNGCGATCQTYKGCDKIKRVDLTGAFCELDIMLGQFLVGGTLFRSLDVDEIPLGWEFPSVNAACPNGAVLELWTKAWDGTVQATPAALGGDPAWWHWVFTKTTFQVNDSKLENGFLEFGLTGSGQENPNLPANGPFGDWPEYIEEPGGITTVGGVFLDTFTPTADCAFVAVPPIAS